MAYNTSNLIKEAIYLSASGYIQVRAYTSFAQIPLQDVAVTITDTDGAAIAMRLTNRSGTLNEPVEITVPDLSASQSPDTGVIPFTVVDLYARLEIQQCSHFPSCKHKVPLHFDRSQTL